MQQWHMSRARLGGSTARATRVSVVMSTEYHLLAASVGGRGVGAGFEVPECGGMPLMALFFLFARNCPEAGPGGLLGCAQ